MKTLQINGDSCSTAAASLLELLAELGLSPETVLIEYNGTALHRSEWPAVTLREGDSIELLRVAAGG